MTNKWYGISDEGDMYCIGKCKDLQEAHKVADEMGRILYAPSMPGKQTGQSLPYYFDLVLALRVEKDADGVSQRALLCDSDGLWLAKDRSGKLDTWEPADFGAIIEKIGGVA